MSLRLSEDGIYAGLYRRDDGKYHWALVLADSPFNGSKVHATNVPDPTKWHYVHESFGVSTEWKPLVILAKLDIPSGTSPSSKDAIDSLLRKIPMDTPKCDAPHPFTCRIWFREAVRALDDAAILQCNSVDALERELIRLADEHATLVALGRPWLMYDDVDNSH